jgi:tetratricopeptide (TPR) repeat protein
MGQGSLRWSLVLVMLVAQGCGSGTKPPAPTRNPPQAQTQSPPSQGETLALLKSNQFADLDRRFSAIQTGYRNGTVTDQELRAAFRVFYATDAALEAKYDAWIAQFPNSYVAHLARGIYYKTVGEERRGPASFSETTAQQLRGMEAALGKASQDLRASVGLDAKPLLTYFYMLAVANYLGDKAEVRELLDQSTKADPGNLIVRECYMQTIEPRWGGSVEQMYAFLDESRRTGLPRVRLQLLESTIVAEQAMRHQQDGDYVAAERDYRKAIALGGEVCLPCLAWVLTLENKFEDAIAVYSKVLDSNPADINSRANRGRAYMEAGKVREGLADLTAAAGSGDEYSENELGKLNMMGIPGLLAPNPEAGVQWFRKAAAQGNPAAIQNLETALAGLAAQGPGAQTVSPAAPPPH